MCTAKYNGVERPRDFLKRLAGDRPSAFLVGAGVSIPPPTSLPSGKELHLGILEALSLVTPDLLPYWRILIEGVESESENQLRFEETVGLVAPYDPHLDVLRMLFDCRLPNWYHYFFAKMLSGGALVLTTNFDCLIEQAAQNVGTAIQCLCSVSEFRESLFEPVTFEGIAPYASQLPREVVQWLADHKEQTARMARRNLPAILKLHGSPRTISGEDSRATILTTLQDICAQRPTLLGEPQFGKEILRGRPLVVVGYSGSDDFDILPWIRQSLTTEPLVWLSHEPDRDEVIGTAGGTSSCSLDKSPGIARIAKFLTTCPGGPHWILRTDSTTALKGLADVVASPPAPNVSTKPDLRAYLRDWASRVFTNPGACWYICGRALLARRHLDAAAEVFDLLVQQTHITFSSDQEASVRNMLGCARRLLGDYVAAMDAFAKCSELFRQTGNFAEAAKSDSNLAAICLEFGQFDEAIRLCRRAYYTFRVFGLDADAAIARHTSSRIARALNQTEVEVANLKVATRASRRGGNPGLERLCLQRLRELGVSITAPEFGFDMDEYTLLDLARS